MFVVSVTPTSPVLDYPAAKPQHTHPLKPHQSIVLRTQPNRSYRNHSYERMSRHEKP
jgi:hypothetical protein